jgi:hypothetical protein
MEEHPAEPESPKLPIECAVPVALVARYGVAQVRSMNSNLMRAARLDGHLYERGEFAIRRQSLESAHCRPTRLPDTNTGFAIALGDL